ncbi:hypothetical protein C8Q76DRAFT_800944 [Earliella scabrosa]|nr:hypothetical protein C8Q76DRAFT_800944 [Earliella scabrosa]
MPELTTLTLELAQLNNIPRQALWSSPVTSTEFPCPKLQSLVVSYPHPDDELYGHLPSHLRKLSLKCWPRHYLYLLSHDKWKHGGMGWFSPILTSSEMLRILEQSSLPQLQELDVECIADEDDAALWRYIPSAFPRLHYLRIHRYRDRSRHIVDVPVSDIARSLAGLRALRVLFVHLDFKTAPHPWAMYNRTGKEEFAALWESMTSAADILARTLAPSVEYVCLLRRELSSNLWTPFHIERTEDGVGEPRAVYDKTLTEIDGFCLTDENGPYFGRGRWYAGPFVVDD